MLLSLLFLTSIFLSATAQQDVKTMISVAGKQLDEAFQERNSARLRSYYDQHAVVMPEFHVMLQGNKSVGDYFGHWLRGTTFNQKERKIAEVQTVGQYAIELGNFRHLFALSGKDTVSYHAKYLRVWSIGDKKAPKIVSEIWGAVNWFERSNLPSIPDLPGQLPPSPIDPQTAARITERNALIKSFVQARDGESHAGLFTHDAIYMPYYENMHIGIDSVHSYFVRHERPDNLMIDSLEIRFVNMIDLGGIVLENGYYRVRWHTKEDANGGTGSGKSINLWKKNDRGEWMMHRQMVNHD